MAEERQKKDCELYLSCNGFIHCFRTNSIVQQNVTLYFTCEDNVLINQPAMWSLSAKLNTTDAEAQC